MKKFIVLYYAPKSASEQMAEATPEQMEEGMQGWLAWRDRCGDAMVDLGTPLINGETITDQGTSSSDKMIAGYSIVQAEDLAAAKKLLDNHPHLGWDPACAIGIHEAVPMPV